MKYILLATAASAALVALAEDRAASGNWTAVPRAEVLSSVTVEPVGLAAIGVGDFVAVSGLDAPARVNAIVWGGDAGIDHYVILVEGREVSVAPYRVSLASED